MCGIYFFTNATKNKCDRAKYVLNHRGPDDANQINWGSNCVGINRLSIQDVKLGRQPIHSTDGSKLLVMNGEIFNHHEIRLVLQNKGLKFYSNNSDTETVMRAYEYWGDNAFK